MIQEKWYILQGYTAVSTDAIGIANFPTYVAVHFFQAAWLKTNKQGYIVAIKFP